MAASEGTLEKTHAKCKNFQYCESNSVYNISAYRHCDYDPKNKVLNVVRPVIVLFALTSHSFKSSPNQA